MEWGKKILDIFPQWESTIITIKPSLAGAPDKLIWLGTDSGEYTTKSGYHTSIKLRTATEETNRRWGGGSKMVQVYLESPNLTEISKSHTCG